VLALGSSFFVVFTRDSATSGELSGRADHLFQVFRPEKVSQISVEAAGRRVVIRKQVLLEGAPGSTVPAEPETDELRADEDAEGETADAKPASEPHAAAVWDQVEPLQGTAEVARIDELLRAAHFATFIRKIAPEDVQRGAFGLANPKPVLTLTLGTTTYVIRVGGNAPAPRDARYLELSGAPAAESGVFVVSGNTCDGLSVTPDSFVLRQVVPYAGSMLRSLVLEQANRRLALEQAGKGDFRFVDAFGRARVARDAMDRLLLGLARTQTEPILVLAEAQAALGADATQVTLTPKDPKLPVAKLRFGGACPGFADRTVAIRDEPTPIAGCVPKLGLVELLAAPELLVDRALFRLRADEIEAFSVKGRDRSLDVVREGHSFKMRAPAVAAIDEDVGRARAEAISEVRGEWLGSDSAPDGPPTREIELSSGGATDADVTTERVQIWEEAGGRGLARRLSDGAWLRLNPTAMRVFAVDSLLVRKRQLLDLEDAKIQTVTVTWGASVQVLSQPERGQFELTLPSGYKSDGGLAVLLVDTVRGLTAESWIAEQDDGSFGFASQTAEFRVVETTGEIHEFIVGGRAGMGSFYAKQQNADPIFTLKASAVETLTTWLVDRSGFMLEPSAVDTLSLKSPHGALDIKRLGSELVQVGGDFQLGQAKLSALGDVLSTVRPDAAVAFDANNPRYGFLRPSLDVRIKLTDGSTVHWQVGLADTFRDTAIFYARVMGQAAVFVIPRQTITRILDAL